VAKQTADRNSRARLEALRREQKRKETRRNLLVYGGAGVVALLLLAGVVTYALTSASGKSANHQVGYVAGPTAVAKAASCTGVRNDAQVGHTHVSPDKTVNYAAAPPSSGDHDADPLPDSVRFYTAASGIRIERAVHNLEHGFVVAWYDAGLPADQVTKLHSIAENSGNRFIAVPWSRSVFSGDQHFVLTAWDRTERCGTVSQGVITEFIHKYTDPGGAGVSWDSPTAPEFGAAGGTLNVTETGPIAGATAAGAGTMSTTAPTTKP
jgi:hypothetical protein